MFILLKNGFNTKTSSFFCRGRGEEQLMKVPKLDTLDETIRATSHRTPYDQLQGSHRGQTEPLKIFAFGSMHSTCQLHQHALNQTNIFKGTQFSVLTVLQSPQERWWAAERAGNTTSDKSHPLKNRKCLCEHIGMNLSPILLFCSPFGAD